MPPDLSGTIEGVVLALGLAAILAAVTGARVVIGGNELSVTSSPARVATFALGAVLAAWGAWSATDKPFRLEGVEIVEWQTIVEGRCPRSVQVSARFSGRDTPGEATYRVWLVSGTKSVAPDRVFRVEFKRPGKKLVGPHTIPVGPLPRTPDAAIVIAVLAPTEMQVGTPVSLRCKQRPSTD